MPPAAKLSADLVVDDYDLTVTHAAHQLKTSEATIRRMYERGELPGIRRSNGARWFRQSDVDAVRQDRRDRLARAGDGGRGRTPDAA